MKSHVNIIVNRLFSKKFILWFWYYALKVTHFDKLYSDTEWVKLVYHCVFGKRLDLQNPATFNAKLNWLKLYDRNPKYSQMADKYSVKEYVSNIIGEEYVVPCYGVWDNVQDIDFTKLPKQYVLKTTHDSSRPVIVMGGGISKKQFNKIRSSLKSNYYLLGREWPYKDIKPRILAEKYLDDHSGKELTDYKFWCFNGVPKFMYITNKSDDVFENFYDMDFNPVDINHGFRRMSPEFNKPQRFDEMKNLAAKLSSGILFVRIDFFYLDDKIYFGEFTFYDHAGLRPFSDIKTDIELGELIKISRYER